MAGCNFPEDYRGKTIISVEMKSRSEWIFIFTDGTILEISAWNEYDHADLCYDVVREPQE